MMSRRAGHRQRQTPLSIRLKQSRRTAMRNSSLRNGHLLFELRKQS